MVNILGSVGQMVSDATTELNHSYYRKFLDEWVQQRYNKTVFTKASGKPYGFGPQALVHLSSPVVGEQLNISYTKISYTQIHNLTSIICKILELFLGKKGVPFRFLYTKTWKGSLPQLRLHFQK